MNISQKTCIQMVEIIQNTLSIEDIPYWKIIIKNKIEKFISKVENLIPIDIETGIIQDHKLILSVLRKILEALKENE